MGFSVATGEVERGTLPLVLVLTYTIRRWDILLGRFTAHLAMLSLVVAIGHGLAAAALAFAGTNGGTVMGLDDILGSAVFVPAALLPPPTRASALTRWQGAALGAKASITLDHPAADPLITIARAEVERSEGISGLYRASSSLAQLNASGVLSTPPRRAPSIPRYNRFGPSTPNTRRSMRAGAIEAHERMGQHISILVASSGRDALQSPLQHALKIATDHDAWLTGIVGHGRFRVLRLLGRTGPQERPEAPILGCYLPQGVAHFAPRPVGCYTARTC